MQHLRENIVSMSSKISSLSCYRCSSISVTLCSLYLQAVQNIFKYCMFRASRYNPTSTTDSHLKRISTNCWIHTFVPRDDGPRYAQNM